MSFLLHVIVAAAAPLANDGTPPPAISAEAIQWLLLAVGGVLTLALIGFFAFVIWNETRKDRESQDDSV